MNTIIAIIGAISLLGLPIAGTLLVFTPRSDKRNSRGLWIVCCVFMAGIMLAAATVEPNK